jgi:lipoprotein-releasing system permease protein
MGFSFTLALRYMRSKKQASISVGTMFAILGVALGVAALATVISVTGGFRAEFRQKVLGVNAHVLVLKYTSDFRDYRKVMETVRKIPGVIGVAPFVINPMMVTHGDRTATGVLLKGVDPERVKSVLDLPQHITEGSLQGLRVSGSKPPERRRQSLLDESGSRSKDGTPSPAGSASASSPGGVLAEVRKALEREKANDAGSAATPYLADAGAAPNAENEEESAEEPLPSGAPVGNVEPDGGYASILPDDDPIPEELDPDPCKDAEAVKKLPGIVIGSALRTKLRANLGDCIQVTSPTIGFVYARGAMHAPVAKRFRVVAIFSAGFDQYDSKLVYTDLYESQAFYDSGDSVTGVEMKVADIERAHEIKRVVEKTLASGLYHVMDWEELNRGLFTALRIQQILMSLVLALIIVVAAFTVIATLIMIVLDKKKEIAVLKAMGAANGSVLRTFLYQGGIIGTSGTVVGLALGYGICRVLSVYGLPLDPGVYFISKLPVLIRLSDFVQVGLFAILVCLIATVWPALHAARLRPAEAFRENL